MLLIVDDTESTRNYLREMLSEELHVDVVVADSGAAALKILSTQSICVVVSDLKMPVINGMELLAICRKMYANLPFFLVSTDPIGLEQCAIQPTGVCDKFSLSELMKMLAPHLTRHITAKRVS